MWSRWFDRTCQPLFALMSSLLGAYDGGDEDDGDDDSDDDDDGDYDDDYS